MQRRHVHAMVAGWVDRMFSQELHDHAIKPFSIGRWHTVDGVFVLPVRLLIDQLTEPLLEAVAVARSLRLGNQDVRLIPTLDGAPAQFASGHPWEELLRSGPATGWELVFTTLTTFRAGPHYQPFPLPTSVLGHLRTRWTAFAPDEIRHLGSTPLKDLTLLTERVDLRTAQDINYKARVHGVTGTVTQRGVDIPEDMAWSIGAWLSLTRYAGIGYGTTRGYGVTEVRRHQ